MSMRTAYEEKLQAQLDEWSAEIARLKARADQASAQGKIEYQQQMEELRAAQEAARQKLIELRDSGDHAWEDLKLGLEGAWARLSSALESARSRFR